MKEVSVERIKQRFPKPKTFEQGKIRPGSYCVGGAMMDFVGLPNGAGFPDVDEIAAFLGLMNPKLLPEEADQYAEEIVGLNDKGHFSLAWQKAEEALETDS